MLMKSKLRLLWLLISDFHFYLSLFGNNEKNPIITLYLKDVRICYLTFEMMFDGEIAIV